MVTHQKAQGPDQEAKDVVAPEADLWNLRGPQLMLRPPSGALGIKGAWLDAPTLGNPLRGAWFRGVHICHLPSYISWLCCGVPLAAG